MTTPLVGFSAATVGAAATVMTAVSSFAAQGAPPADLMLTEVWNSATVAWGQPLGRVEGLAESAPGTIWVSDTWSGSGRVVVVREEGGPETVVGRPGEGPGEVDSPGPLALTPGGNVAMYDLGAIAVVEYSRSGEPLRRTRLPVRVSWPKGFAVLPSGQFVISGPVPGVDAAIHQFTHAGTLLRSWARPAAATNWRAGQIATGGALYTLSDGSVLYTQGAPHRVVRYLPSGTDVGWEERELAAITTMFEPPGDEVIVETIEDGVPVRSFWITYPQSRGVYQMSDGSILNVVVMADEGRSVWQLFGGDPVGLGDPELIAAATIPEAYTPWFRCDNDDILAHREDPVTGEHLIVRLRIDVNAEENDLTSHSARGGMSAAPGRATNQAKGHKS